MSNVPDYPLPLFRWECVDRDGDYLRIEGHNDGRVLMIIEDRSKAPGEWAQFEFAAVDVERVVTALRTGASVARLFQVKEAA